MGPIHAASGAAGRRVSPRTVAALLFALWALAAGCRRSDESQLSAARSGGPSAGWLTEIAVEVGLDFVHESGGVGELHLPEIMGAGAALLDIEGDGDLDIYLVNGALELGGSEALQGPANRLYRQEPDGSFRDVTEGSGLADRGYGMGVAVGDFDNNGLDDVYLTNLGADRLYRNVGGGRFEDATARAEIEVAGWSTSATFLDYDRDGYLDLYVTRYVAYDPAVKCYDTAGRHEYCGPSAYPPISDVLLHNQGDGTFRDASGQAGIDGIAGAGLGVACDDFNEDGWIDVYVANDADPNQLWINQHDGTFQDQALLLGASVNAQGLTEAGMGVVAADLDGDLRVDLFMTHLVNESNTFYRNLGQELGFEDVSALSGLASSSAPFTGFGTAAFDADLDGDVDLAVVNGRVLRGPLVENTLTPPWNDYAEPNLFYLNEGRGRFSPVGEGAATFCDMVGISRGLATGDIDDDGDLDLLVSNTQGPARLYRNDASRLGRWLIVEPYDPSLHRLALGAVVTAVVGESRQRRVSTAGFSYLSSSDPRVHFGLGEVRWVERLEVRWPDGLREGFPEVEADQVVRLNRGQGEAF